MWYSGRDLGLIASIPRLHCAAEAVVVPPRPVSRKRRRQTAELPPVLASNILVDNLEDHEVFFDRASARRRPTERQRG